MYLHLGAGVTICLKELIGIFDYGLVNSVANQEYWQTAQWDNKITALEGKAKSIVVTEKKIYVVPVSRTTLTRRWQQNQY